MIAVLVHYLPLLLLTLALELAVVAALASTPRRAALRACLALNLVTHPLATLTAWELPGPGLLAIELAVFLAEWAGYQRLLRLSPWAALRLALPANAVSLAAGGALWMLYLGA